MILVDTSVMIDFFKGKDNVKTNLFSEVLHHNIPFGFSAFTYQELLQGALDKNEFEKLDKYLSSQKIYFIPEDIKVYEKAAEIYFRLRRNGITIRSTIDILIAITAIENNLLLLHNDRDFDNISNKISNLNILNKLK